MFWRAKKWFVSLDGHGGEVYLYIGAVLCGSWGSSWSCFAAPPTKRHPSKLRRRRWPVVGRGPRCEVAEVEEETRGRILECGGGVGGRHPEVGDRTEGRVLTCGWLDCEQRIR